jgi:hypothetical protein
METLLEDDHPRTIWIKFRFIQFSGSEEDLQLFNHSEAMAVKSIGHNFGRGRSQDYHW